MSQALAGFGFTVPQFTSSTGSGDTQPAIYLGDRRGTGLQQLRDFVQQYSGKEHCCDQVFIYYTGHGKRRRESGEYRHYFGLRFSYRGEDGNRSGRRRMYAEDFAQILSGLASCHIHVLIDSCYSGGFVSALSALDGVETVRTSAGDSEKAWGGAVDGANGGRTPDPYGRAQGEKGSEFTSGFVKGLTDLAAQHGDNAKNLSGREIVSAGFSTAVANDIAAIARKTNPTGFTRAENECDCCDDDTVVTSTSTTSSMPVDETTSSTSSSTTSTVPAQDTTSSTTSTQGGVDLLDPDYWGLPAGNTVLNSTGVDTTAAAGATDLLGVGVVLAELDGSQFESDYPCGLGAYGLTLCPQSPLQENEGYYLVFAEVAADLPLELSEYQYQIGFVLDSDGSAANNYQASPSWPADFFDGTDFWYTATCFDAGAGWSMSISDTGGMPVAESAARIIFSGNTVMCAIPSGDVTASDASFRVTVYRAETFGSTEGFWNADLSSAVGETLLPLSGQ